MILEKVRSCLWKLELGFSSHGLIRLLGPSDPNVASRSQAPRSRHFSKFPDFIRFISWFLRKWGPVCENWSQGSGFMTGYVFWTQVAQMKCLRPRSEGQDIFSVFIMLLDLSHDSWGNAVLFVKIGVRVLNLWLDMSCGANWPKCSF